MAALSAMPPIEILPETLLPFGQTWQAKNKSLGRTAPNSSGQLGRVFDLAVGKALASMLGNIQVDLQPNSNALKPSCVDCVEVGPVRIVGGVRPQNFDVGYRPDGVRFAFDSKTLNDKKSVGKNWQNMINDLATEATTVHSRFPHAVVAFLVAIPAPCIEGKRLTAIIQTLERLTRRVSVEDPLYRAEAITLIIWNPSDGSISTDTPGINSLLRIETFSEQIQSAYISRYKGLPPHINEMDKSNSSY